MNLKRNQQRIREVWGEFIGSEKVAVSLRPVPLTPSSYRKNERQEGHLAEAEVRTILMDQSQDIPVLTTRSHTRTAEGAWILLVGCLAQGIRQIGVDIERSDRVVTPLVKERIVRPVEEKWGLSLLEHWVIKEACFKASPGNDGSVLWQYRLTSYIQERYEGTVEGPGGGTCQFRLLQLPGWILAFAKSLLLGR